MAEKKESKSVSRTKFNVDRDTESRTYNDIVFDSKLEMRYYRDVVLPLSRSGEIAHYELQKKYTLQPKFTHGGKTILPIEYVADFYIEYADGRKVIVDTKGFADSVAKIKRKMMWYLFPDIEYIWITFVQKYGGWLEYDEVAKLRRQARKDRAAREQKENEDG